MDGSLSVVDDHPLPGLDGPITSSMRRTSMYSIHVTSDENTALKALAEAVGSRMIAMITDEEVDRLHAERIKQWLSGHASKVQKVILPPGEASKSLPTACHLLDWLAQSDMRRRDILVAVGGGAIMHTTG